VLFRSLEDENGKIVGSMGNIPLLYEFQGRRILVASGRSWVSEPAYRSVSLLLLDRVINQPGVDLYLNTTVTAASIDAVCAFECLRVPVGVWDESAFWITDYQAFSESILASKNYRAAKWLSHPLSVGLFLMDTLKKRALREGDVEVKALQGFDDRFDTFWDELKRSAPDVLLGVRTREMLDWHFWHALLDGRLWIVAVMDCARLVAYGIFERYDNPKPGFSQLRLQDFQSLDGSTALLIPILAWTIRKCRAEGIAILETLGRWLENEEIIATTAPHRSKLPNWTYFYRANHPALAVSLRDRRSWAPSLFDGNASLG